MYAEKSSGSWTSNKDASSDSSKLINFVTIMQYIV